MIDTRRLLFVLCVTAACADDADEHPMGFVPPPPRDAKCRLTNDGCSCTISEGLNDVACDVTIISGPAICCAGSQWPVSRDDLDPALSSGAFGACACMPYEEECHYPLEVALPACTLD
jgi:hypothetical protein